MSNDFKTVTKEEFDLFVKSYGKPLVYDVSHISDPPMGNHNDFSDGKVWPESMVTRVFLYDPKDPRGGKDPEYQIATTHIVVKKEPLSF